MSLFFNDSLKCFRKEMKKRELGILEKTLELVNIWRRSPSQNHVGCQRGQGKDSDHHNDNSTVQSFRFIQGFITTTLFYLHSLPTAGPTHIHLLLSILWMRLQLPFFILRVPSFLSYLTGVLNITQDLAEIIVYLFNKYLSTATVLGNLARYWKDRNEWNAISHTHGHFSFSEAFFDLWKRRAFLCFNDIVL